MLKFSAVSQIWKKYIQKLNDWDLPLTDIMNACNFNTYLYSCVIGIIQHMCNMDSKLE